GIFEHGGHQLASCAGCAESRVPAFVVGYPDGGCDPLPRQSPLFPAAGLASRRAHGGVELVEDGRLGDTGLLRDAPRVDILCRGADTVGENVQSAADVFQPAVVRLEVELPLALGKGELGGIGGAVEQGVKAVAAIF